MLDCEFFVVPFGVSVAFFPGCTMFPALPAEGVCELYLASTRDALKYLVSFD